MSISKATQANLAMWPSCPASPQSRAADRMTPGTALPQSRGHPRPPMAHIRWQTPANGLDMLAMALGVTLAGMPETGGTGGSR